MPSLQTLPGIEFVPLNNSQWRLQERNWLCSKSSTKLKRSSWQVMIISHTTLLNVQLIQLLFCLIIYKTYSTSLLANIWLKYNDWPVFLLFIIWPNKIVRLNNSILFVSEMSSGILCALSTIYSKFNNVA